MNDDMSDAAKAKETDQAERINANLPGGTAFPEADASGSTATEADDLGRAASTAVGGLVPDGASDASDAAK